MGRLQGKVAIITGAAGGIGRAAARKFVAEGAQVWLTDLEPGPLSELAGELGAGWSAGDISLEKTNAEMVSGCVARFGGVDILFANAGTEGRVKPLIELTPAEFDHVLAINVRGTWLSLRAAVPEMRKRGRGSIVATSSIAGLIGSQGLGVYVASKHAVMGLVKSAAIELAPLRIRVNAVNPGPIDNRMMRSIEGQIAPGAAEQVKAGFTGLVPLGRYGTNEEIANVALFLASEESAYCTGASFVADGGFVVG
jgi:3alpha(or 20beta)-hydroxysteroid dehydrogenase